MDRPEKALKCEGQKKGSAALSVSMRPETAANGVRNVGGRLAPDPRRVAENFRTYFQVEAAYATDLFGEPVQPGRGQKGRPRHVPTVATRLRVRELRALCLSIAAIARELGVSHPTLQLNYPVELGSGSSTWRRRAADNSSRPGGATEGSK